jgi:tRNA modification GTPase
MKADDTIAAVCTGAGGAVGIVRISGPGALFAAGKIWRSKHSLSPKNARKMLLGHLVDSPVAQSSQSEPALAVFMPGPGSYTGEDVVEIHCHGGSLCPKRVLDAALASGVRAAGPGEFTKRAFLNGKMDLTQAEAVADIITAESQSALRLAERQMSGALGEAVKKLRNGIINILAECESRLDFAEEDLEWTDKDVLADKLSALSDAASALAATEKQGGIIRGGVRVVIAGAPNAGKSSLLNSLLGHDRAIVSHLPGTTRDTVEERALIRGIPVRLIDTAGIRAPADAVEEIGVERARNSIAAADFVLWTLDAAAETGGASAEPPARPDPELKNVIAVWNKMDLVPGGPESLPDVPAPRAFVSALKKTGLEELFDLIEAAVWGGGRPAEPEFAVNSRHAARLGTASSAVASAVLNIQAEAWEIAALHLRDAIADLGSVTGETAGPDILDNIFSRFCVGK